MSFPFFIGRLYHRKKIGHQKIAMRIYPKGVTPECFNRGSTVLTMTLSHVEWVRGPVSVSPGFPPKDGSVQSLVADPLKARGNDGILEICA
jgi:hypothetical protein